MAETQQCPLNTALVAFLSFLRLERGVSENTYASYRYDLGPWVAFLRGKGISSWEAVGREAVEAFLETLKDCQSRTLARKRSSLRLFARFLLKERLCERDWAQGLKNPKGSQSLPQALSLQEVESLLGAPSPATAQGLRDKAMMELMYSSGLRISELCTLPLQALQDNQVRVWGKGRKERIVPVGSKAIEALQRYLHEGRSVLAKKHSGSALFLSQLGRPVSRKTFWLKLKAYAQQVGIQKNIKPHQLRHSFASHLLAHGADLRAIQEMLGHSSITTTQIYTSIQTDQRLEAHMDCHPRSSMVFRG